ncbi:hypothetical protein Patl1_04561 [Pistacia atlantica]|uniref:Uncharacterized protein n=1 Tax=Pistacia atlantica TaxID=434234 RepID=A0ACC1BWB9_9ROSI|nr:hypothetical protein Patl1_04561 [Pistacia atlantica]
MRLWIAEGFVEYDENQTLEEVAENYLIELIDRSLVQVVKRDISGRIRSCKVHGLMYEIILQKTKGLEFLSSPERRARRIQVSTVLQRGAFQYTKELITLRRV